MTGTSTSFNTDDEVILLEESPQYEIENNRDSVDLSNTSEKGNKTSSLEDSEKETHFNTDDELALLESP